MHFRKIDTTLPLNAEKRVTVVDTINAIAIINPEKRTIGFNSFIMFD
jgi:hypothetical protein